MSDNTYIAHYGVMGMKWGVRKQQPSSGNRVRTGTSTTYNNRSGNVSKGTKRAVSSSTSSSKSFQANWSKLTPEQKQKIKQTAVRLGISVTASIISGQLVGATIKQASPIVTTAAKAAVTNALSTVGNTVVNSESVRGTTRAFAEKVSTGVSGVADKIKKK